MTTYTVAAVDSPQAKKDIASHVCDGIDDHVQINLAIGDSKSGDTVLLYEGTYNLLGSVYPKGGTELRGVGRDYTYLKFTNNCAIYLDNQYITIGDLNIEASNFSPTPRWWAGVVNVRSSHCNVERVTATADNTLGCVFHTVSCNQTPVLPLQNIEWNDCEVIDTGTYGFLHNWWDGQTAARTHQNIRYINCRAIRCGNAYGTCAKGVWNGWETGFDFAEGNSISGLYVKGCRAEGNWQSGFHMEWDPIKTNCVLEDCVSIDNGAKPYPNNHVRPHPQAPEGELGDFFGSGYCFPNCNGRLTRCYSEGNTRCGFWVTNGALLEDCEDVDCGRGRSDFTYIWPTSFYGYPCRTGLVDGRSLQLIRCKSINSRGFGFWYESARDLWIEDAEMINPVGLHGAGARFGTELGEWLLDSTIAFKRIETPSGISAIHAYNNQRVNYKDAVVVSDAEKPFRVTGNATDNVSVTDWTTVSQMLPVGDGGVTIEGGAAVEEVTLNNVVVVSTDPVESGAWLEGYPYRVSVDIDPDYVDADLADIPVPIAVDNSVFTHLFGEIGADWAKMMITDNAGTALKAEVTLWDPTLMKGLLYVRVPVISATEPTPIHIYYGASVPVNPLLGFTTDASAEAVWEDLNYEGVWHSRQGETPRNMVDSSSKQHDIATQGSPTFGTLGPRNFVDFPIGGYGMAPVGYSTLNSATAITVEATVRLDNLSLDTWNEQMWFGQNSPAGHRFYLAAYGNPPRWAGAIGNQAWTVNDGPVCSEEITHIAWVVDKSTSIASLYVNGTLVETKTGWTWGDLNANPYLAWANATAGAPAEPYRSDITFFDLKISTALRSATWIKALAMAELGTLYTYHEYEEAPVEPIPGS